MPWSGSGAGTSGDPYQVTSLAQLYEVADYPTDHFIQMNDIDASDTSSGANTQPWNSADGWKPVAGVTFSGNYNFDGFKITGLYTHMANGGVHVGLFERVSGTITKGAIAAGQKSITWTVVGQNNGDAVRNFGGVCAFADSNATIDVDTEVTATGQVMYRFGGICGQADGTNIDFSNSEPTVDLHSDGGYANNIGGVVGYARQSVNMQYCKPQFKVLVENPAISTAVFNIGGVAGWAIETGNNYPNAEFCRANIDIDCRTFGKRIGGIYGDTQGSLANPRIYYSWAIGKIVGDFALGGLVGNGARLQALDNWYDVDLYPQNATSAKSGLLAGLDSAISSTFLQRNLGYGDLRLPNGTVVDYSADINDQSGSFVDIIHNTDSLTDFNVGDVGDLTQGTGLTTLQLQDSAYLDANTGMNFSSVWQAGGYNSYMDLQGNLYDAAFIIHPKTTVTIVVQAASNHIDVDSAMLTGSHTGVDETELDSKGIEYGTSSGTYTTDVPIAQGSPHQAQVDALAELDVLYFRAYVIYQGTRYNSDESTYTHYEVDQVDVDAIVVEEYVNSTPASHNIHGSVLVNIAGTDFIFGSPREPGINTINDDVNADILKYNATDYTIVSTLTVIDQDGNKMNSFNTIVDCNGFLWTIGRTALNGATGITFYTYLVRIDPVTMEYVCFRSHAGGTFNLSEDAHGTDETRYLFTGASNVSKLDTDQLIGVYANASYHDIPAGAIVGEYDHTTQGYYLHPSAPTSFDEITKGTIHSMVVSGEHVFASYTTSSDFNAVEGETESEMHKIKISDMSADGFARTPKTTDDATQDSENIYLGIETRDDGGASPSPNMGYDWGVVAVRKSDMAVFATARLHPTDVAGTRSYASTVFGNRLIDQKTNGTTYVVDISQVYQWQQIDQFATPGSWGMSETIGQRTLKAFKLYQSYTDEQTNVPVNGIPNEIMFDSLNKFHSFGWGNGSTGSPSSLMRYEIAGVSFLAPPTVQTFNAVENGGNYDLTGLILDDNGGAVTQVGFRWGTNPLALDNQHLEAYASDSFTHQITVGVGTWYYRAIAVNSEGTGEGALLSFTIADETAPNLSNVSLTKSGDNVALSFDSDEQLGSADGDIAVSIDSPNTTNIYTFNRSQFTETENLGVYTYTLNAIQAYDDGFGIYTATIDVANDASGNNGADVLDVDTYDFVDPTAGNNLTGAVTNAGVGQAGVNVLLIDQSTKQVVETTTTDVDGNYSFTGRSDTIDFLVVVYTDAGLTDYAKPNKRFTNS
jgi:hypothetical protein